MKNIGMLMMGLLNFFIFCFSWNLFAGEFASMTGKYVSLKDLQIYANQTFASTLSNELETFARAELVTLNDQTLLSVRPQSEIVPGEAIDFILFFLKKEKKTRSKSQILKISTKIDSSLTRILEPKIAGVYELNKTQFSVDVSLVDLKAQLSDAISGAKFVIPIGGPAFDQGVLPRSKGHQIFVTPTFSGMMSSSSSYESRTDPPYYKGKPFLAVAPKSGAGTLYGFHTTPFGYIDKHVDNNELVRGFVSAGCMRLKDDDLYEMFYIVAYSGKMIPVEIQQKGSWIEQHPFPMILNGYHKVSGYCPKIGKGNSECLPEPIVGSRIVYSTKWIEKDPMIEVSKLYDYGKANVNHLGFEIPGE